MSLGVKPRIVTLTVPVLIAALAAAACVGGSQAPLPAQPPQETPNILTIISATPKTTKTPESQRAILNWKGNAPYLTYEKGYIAWTVSIAEGIEDFLWRRASSFKTPDDFFMGGAVIDEKYERVIAWGNVHNSIFGKISFRNFRDGAEISGYWLDEAVINQLLPIYDVPTAGGKNDLLIIAGETHSRDIANEAGRLTGFLTYRVPLIEVRQLTENSSTPLTYNPVTYVEGSVSALTDSRGKIITPALNAVRDDKGNVTLEIATITRTNPDGGVSSVKLDELLKLEWGVPIFGRS